MIDTTTPARPPRPPLSRAKTVRSRRRWARRLAHHLPPREKIEQRVRKWLHRRHGRPLDWYADRLCSQRGEDGITVELFRRIGIEHGRAIEIGCGQNGGNAAVLALGLNFNTLLLDGSDSLVNLCQKAHPTATVLNVWITRESIGALLTEHGFDRDIDYVGIDLDGVDYWIWEALPVRPRLLICEYNPVFGPEEAVTVAYTPDFSRKSRTDDWKLINPKGYFGASITALERLGARLGYRLVATVPNNANVFFIRDDLAPEIPAVPAREVWRPHMKGGARWQDMYDTIHTEGLCAYFEARGATLVEIDPHSPAHNS